VVASGFSAVKRVVADKRKAVADELRRYETSSGSVASGLVPDGFLTAGAEFAEGSCREDPTGFELWFNPTTGFLRVSAVDKYVERTDNRDPEEAPHAPLYLLAKS